MKGEAENFAKAAAELNEKVSGGPQPSKKATLGSAAQEFADNSAELAAKVYADTYIIPKIDGLINSHSDGSGIPQTEIESTFKEVMNQMVVDGIMTKEELTAYTALSRVETQQQVDTGETRQVPKHKEDRGGCHAGME